MKGLTDYCGMERLTGDIDRDLLWRTKWPRLMEAYEELERNGDLVSVFPKEEMENLKPHSALDDAKVVACLVCSMDITFL